VLFARELRQRRPRTSSQWHLDEVVVVGARCSVQVTGTGSALPFRSCRRLQHVQLSASSHLAPHASPLQGERDEAMAGSHCGGVKRSGNWRLFG
jgi:hypothetical protein